MNKKEFKEKLQKLDYTNALISIGNRRVIIEKVSERDIRNAVGGGYGQYLGEPDTYGAYLIKESLSPCPIWTVETTIPKRYRKLDYEIKNKNEIKF